MSCRSSVIPEIKGCFHSDFASRVSFAQVTLSQEAWRVSSVFAATTTAAPAFQRGGWNGSLCWQHLRWHSPPQEKHSRRNEQDTSLRCPFKSLQSENVKFTSEATVPTKQGMLCFSATKKTSAKLDWCSCHPISTCNFLEFKTCGRTALQQLYKNECSAAFVFHMTI